MRWLPLLCLLAGPLAAQQIEVQQDSAVSGDGRTECADDGHILIDHIGQEALARLPGRIIHVDEANWLIRPSPPLGYRKP